MRPSTTSRDGYDRDAFRHWNTGADPSDGCNTRAEVLLAEAVAPPVVGPGCRLSGGRWCSYYDQVWVTSASGLDIDHMVPLAESWGSGASAWTVQRREAYANDQGADASLGGCHRPLEPVQVRSGLRRVAAARCRGALPVCR